MKSSKEIEEICRKYGIKNYTINEDGSIDVDGNVNLMGKGLTELPLTFNRVNGYFHCSHNYLTTLEGSPKHVNGYFNCSSNELTSLEHGPEYVDRDFNCRNNRLTSLEYSPLEVGKEFNCSDNPKLTSLEGSPKKVWGNFVCSGCRIVDLYGISDDIGYDIYFGNKSPISSISEIMDMDFVRAFNSYRVIKDGKVVLKRLKYVMEAFDMDYDLEKIKVYYEII